MFQLEIRLAEKEEQMLEKDLVFEQVCRLGDRVKTKAKAGKDDTLNLAKKVQIEEISNCGLHVLQLMCFTFYIQWKILCKITSELRWLDLLIVHTMDLT